MARCKLPEYTQFNFAVGRRVRRLRKRRGLSQIQLAAAVYPGEGVVPGSCWVSRVEQGVRPLWGYEARRIAEIFRVPLQDLLCRTGAKSPVEIFPSAN
jgi:transcriptional regulator with XRE-family HTH domain